MRGLRFSDKVSLPADVVTQKLAYLGLSGSGKTYGAGKLAELLLDIGAQVVILDHVGNWYGLRIAADGKGKGIPIPVFGGLHGDIPLEPESGALVADVIVEKEISCVLDVNLMRKNQRREFVTAFAEQLFHRKKQARSPLHLMIEECQAFVPQKVFRGEERMLGAFEDIIKVGRNYGLGVTLISQRPQAVNKDALNQCGTLVVFRTIGAQERTAILGWVTEKGLDIKALVDELPGLPTGTAYLWSPEFLKKLERVTILPKQTFDASATPRFGARSAKARNLAPVDLATIREAMKSVVERAERDDPAVLRRKIAELERKVTQRTDPKPTREIIKKKHVPVIKERDLKKMKKMVERLATLAEDVDHWSRHLVSLFGMPFDDSQRPVVVKSISRGYASEPVKMLPLSPEKIVEGRKAVKALAAKTRFETHTPESAVKDKCQRAILTVLAQHEDGCTNGKLTILSGYRWSGGFRNALSALRTQGFISGSNSGTMQITNEGVAAISWQYYPLPTGEALREYWLNHPSFGRCERSILKALVKSYPNGLSVEKVMTGPREGRPLCEASGYEWSGGFRNALSRLRTAGVLVGRNTEVMRASHTLFLDS